MTLTYGISRVEELVQEIDQSDFQTGHDGWTTIVEQGRFELTRPHCYSINRDDRSRFELQCLRSDEVCIQRPIGMPDQGQGFRPSICYPKLTIACLERAICVPGGIIVRDDTVLTNSFSATWESYQHRHMTQVNQRWQLNVDRRLNFADLEEIEVPVLYLDNQHIDWFGHVIADLLSPGWAYDYCKSFLNIERLLVLTTAPKFDFVRHLILLLGIPHEDILFIDRPVRCRSLLVATKALQIQEYISPPFVRMWQGINARAIQPSSRQNKRLYISRRANPTRSLIEEKEIEELFKSLGFHVIYPEAYKLDQQIELFANAELVAGCSGSNMFNLAAAKPRGVFLMVSPLLVHYSEQFFCSKHRNTKLHVVIGYVTDEDIRKDPGSVHVSWHLDPSLLKATIKDWIDDSAESR